MDMPNKNSKYLFTEGSYLSNARLPLYSRPITHKINTLLAIIGLFIAKLFSILKKYQDKRIYIYDRFVY